MPTYSPPAPWNGPYPQAVTDEFGNEFEATGPNAIKKPAWVPPALPEFPTPEDCCTYTLSSTATVTEGQPTNIVGAPVSKTNGDTAIQKHPNGFSVWTCANGNWVLDWVCEFPQPEDPEDPIIPEEVSIGVAEPDKNEFKVWFNCTDGCVYYCQNDGCWLAPKGCPSAAGNTGGSDPVEVPHVQIPDDVEDPEAWLIANGGNYPPGTHLYLGDPLTPLGVWVVDDNGTVLCDKMPLLWCDPATGEDAQLPLGSRVMTEDNRPYCFGGVECSPQQVLNAKIKTDMTPASAWTFAEYLHVSPITSVDFTNPDLCREAHGMAHIMGRTNLTTQGDERTYRANQMFDCGDGNLFTFVIGDGSAVSTGVDNDGFANNSNTFVPRCFQTLSIPPGGTITLRVQAIGGTVDPHTTNGKSTTATAQVRGSVFFSSDCQQVEA